MGHISLYVGAKWLVFHLSPRDGHVIIVSGCLILTAVNLMVLIRMVHITKRLVKLYKIYCDIWHGLTWSVCTGGRAHATSWPNFLGWIVYQTFLPMVLRYYRLKMSFFWNLEQEKLGSKTDELKILTGVETTQSFGVFVIERTNQNHGVKNTNDLGI